MPARTITSDPDYDVIVVGVTDLLHARDGATEYLKRVSGLALRCDLGDDHPLVGTAIADLQLDDDTRLFDLARAGRPLLVDLSGGAQLAAAAQPYAGRLRLVRGRAPAGAADSLLVRPDGVVAWASSQGAGDVDRLTAALERWVGTEISARRAGWRDSRAAAR